MTLPDGVVAECPVHGEQKFLRLEMASWWMCPENDGYPKGNPDACWSVILDEDVTPDGADVTDWKTRGKTLA